jgi:hypothetical protein
LRSILTYQVAGKKGGCFEQHGEKTIAAQRRRKEGNVDGKMFLYLDFFLARR